MHAYVRHMEEAYVQRVFTHKNNEYFYVIIQIPLENNKKHILHGIYMCVDFCTQGTNASTHTHTHTKYISKYFPFRQSYNNLFTRKKSLHTHWAQIYVSHLWSTRLFIFVKSSKCGVCILSVCVGNIIYCTLRTKKILLAHKHNVYTTHFRLAIYPKLKFCWRTYVAQRKETYNRILTNIFVVLIMIKLTIHQSFSLQTVYVV